MTTLNLKNLILIGSFLLLSSLSFAQQRQPDTLIVNTVKGKMILISDSIASFRNANAQILINKALDQVKDSLPKTNYSIKSKLPKDSLYTKVLTKKKELSFGGRLGGTFALGKLNPEWALSLDFATQRQDYYWKKSGGATYSFINIALSGLWFFEKPNQGKMQNFQNLFVEASLGNRINNFQNKGVRLINEFSMGAGYLIREKGDYFGKNTFKLFGTIVPNGSFIGFKPEVYFTDNFKSIYPGLSLRLILPSSQLFNP